MMEIKVTKDYVTITSQELHKGEFNINPLHFTFSSDYTDNLVKKVVFTTNQSYMETILNNEATIPYEVLIQKGNVLLGVYAYEVDGENLGLRYSPKPVYLKVEEGSWVEAVDGTTVVPALTLEQYEQAIQEALTQFEIDKDAIVHEAEEEFDTYYNGKVNDFDNNATDKTNTFNSNATSKTNTFNSNATNKTNTFNTNATNKTNTFDQHVTDKTNAFDQHVTDKTTEFDQHLDEYEKTWRGTYAEYEALTKDNNTQYYIEED